MKFRFMRERERGGGCDIQGLFFFLPEGGEAVTRVIYNSPAAADVGGIPWASQKC